MVNAMLFHNFLDNSLFSIFLTSIFSNFKTSHKNVIYTFRNNKSEVKNILKFFTRKFKKIFYNVGYFFYFNFFLCHETSPILGSILHIILDFLDFLYNLEKYVI